MSFREYKVGITQQFYRMTPIVKALVITHITIYLLGLIVSLIGQGSLWFGVLALVPTSITHHFAVWQFITAIFAYAPADIIQLFFGVLILSGVGSELEWAWGKQRFLTIYLIIGILSNVIFYLFLPAYQGFITGTGGAFCGLLAAYTTIYPQRQMFFFGYFLKIKILTLFFAGLAFILSFKDFTNIISLAGFLLGFTYVIYDKKLGNDVRNWFREKLRLWRIRRKYRNFRVVDSDVKKLWDDLEDRINSDDHNSRIN